MTDRRIYTHMSGKALKGLQRLAHGRDVFIVGSPNERGYTVVTKKSVASDRKGTPRS